MPAHASHQLRDVSGGYADFYCTGCNLPQFHPALSEPCARQRRYACTAQHSAGCPETFGSKADSEAHYFAAHTPYGTVEAWRVATGRVA